MANHVVEELDGDPRFSRWEQERGQTMVEYGFLLVAVALVAIAAYQAFGTRVAAMVDTVVW